MTVEAHERLIPLDVPLDLRLTLGPLRHGGRGDPTTRVEAGSVVRATRTPLGPVTVRYATGRTAAGGPAIRITAWGLGASLALERAPAALGLDDDPDALLRLDEAVGGPHPLVHELARRFPGLRFGRSGAVMEALVPAIVEQKVTGTEAGRAWRGLVAAHGEAAPGPLAESLGLRLPPTPGLLAALPYHAYHRFGLEQRRAERIRRAAERGAWLEEGAALPLETAYARLRSLPGIGAWTAAEVGRAAFGDPDAVSVGDFHVPNTVCWALAREPRGTDARMLELLAPYAGQRGRVVRLIEAAGIRAPAYGPRMTPRRIERL